MFPVQVSSPDAERAYATTRCPLVALVSIDSAIRVRGGGPPEPLPEDENDEREKCDDAKDDA